LLFPDGATGDEEWLSIGAVGLVPGTHGIGACVAADCGVVSNQRGTSMYSRFGFIAVAAAAIVAAPVFAQTGDGPTGTWKGTVERSGVQSALTVRLMQMDGSWAGRADVDGAASPLTQVQVEGSRVRFNVKGQGKFEGTLSSGSLTGSISSSSKKDRPPGTFTLSRWQESMEEMEEMINQVIGSFGP
jgi:hypothetical protein